MLICKTIVEAQYKLSQACEYGYGQFIEFGEFANEETFRVQSEPVHVKIKDPLNFIDLPKEISIRMIQNYYIELLNPINAAPGDYSYGERIMQQLPKIMDMIKNTPQTNQAVVEIAQPSDIYLTHKPCLRAFQFIVFGGKLNIFVYFRSNDISEAFIINHGGLALILESVAEYSDLQVGEYHYVSPGAHCYSHSINN